MGKNKKVNKKETTKAGKIFLLILWVVAIVLGLVNVALYNGTMGNVDIEFDWYRSLLQMNNRAQRYYICAGIDLFLFCILVLIYRKKEKICPMLVALAGFTIEIILLMWKIKI